MKTMRLHDELTKKPANHEALAAQVIRQPEVLPEVFEGLTADTARVKYGCLKLLRIISEQRPHILYPSFEKFLPLLGSDNNILKWGAIIVIGNLATVDTEGKIEATLEQYLKPISGPVMITAANVIQGAGKIAVAKPHLVGKIASAVLQVEKARYKTPECRNVAIGHAIESFGRFYQHLVKPALVLAFIQRQVDNSRQPVRLKAAKFLQRHGHDE